MATVVMMMPGTRMAIYCGPAARVSVDTHHSQHRQPGPRFLSIRVRIPELPVSDYWFSGGSAEQLRERALGRRLVLAPTAQLGSMTDAIGGDVVEVDLDDELGA
jgi:hypothetical protein